MIAKEKNGPEGADEGAAGGAAADPAARFANPEDIVADSEVSADQKRRFLEEWAEDLTRRQAAEDEGMAAAGAADAANEAKLLKRIHVAIESLDQADAPPSASAG